MSLNFYTTKYYAHLKRFRLPNQRLQQIVVLWHQSTKGIFIRYVAPPAKGERIISFSFKNYKFVTQRPDISELFAQKWQNGKNKTIFKSFLPNLWKNTILLKFCLRKTPFYVWNPTSYPETPKIVSFTSPNSPYFGNRGRTPASVLGLCGSAPRWLICLYCK